MNGDQVRATWFRPPKLEMAGYDAREVDDLLRRVAAELDAGRPAGPLVENATFGEGKWRRRYDIDAVDWFLGQFLLPQDTVTSSGLSDDPWHDIPVVQLAPDVVSGAARRHGRGKPSRRASRAYFAGQCWQAWRDFGQVPGTDLWWERAAKSMMALRTAGQQTLASVRGAWRSTFSVGGRDFTYPSRRSAGHFETLPKTWSIPPARWSQLVDKETGVPVLYTSGTNYHWRAEKSIMFPDQRWLRFLVRGTEKGNAIMTAVDQAGNRVARYRQAANRDWTIAVQITVHPGQELTDELALALAISADELGSYFERADQGG